MTEAIRVALSAGGLAAVPLMLLGGLMAGLNPCCVALYPAVAATCCGAGGRKAKQAFSAALAFTIGLALATSLLGLIAVFLGRLTTLDRPIRYAIACVPLVMGAHLLGLLKLPLPDVSSGVSRRRIGWAFGSGFLMSLMIGPCSTPIFASALSYAAYKGKATYGAVLLFAYGLGAGVPVLFAGATIGRLAQRLETVGFGTWINRLAGAILLLLGFYLLWIV